MHERRFGRIVVASALMISAGFLFWPFSGAFPESKTFTGKQYISDAGLLQLYDNIVMDASVTDGIVGVGIIHLETDRELYLNKNERFPMASSVKVPVAVHLMKLVDQGRTRLDSLITITGRDFSPGSGNIKYRYAPGKSLPLQYLLEKMLTVSDNSATDIIFRTIGGPAAVTASMIASGVEGMSIDRPIYVLLSNCWGITDVSETHPISQQMFESLMKKVTREKRIEARRNFVMDDRDTTTPEAMAILLEKIWRKEILSPVSSQRILEDMGKSHGDSRIKALLPPGTKVYHKTGTIRGGLSDVGIIELPNNAGHLVTVVFVKGGRTPMHQSENAMALIARDAFDYFQNLRMD
jgi:beta-lactamase class A